jgi:putative hydrolase
VTVEALPAPDQDMHVHSTFSDGSGTIEENLTAAQSRGLTRVTCVDHVRASTDWAADFVREVRRAAAGTDIAVQCGLEAKLLDVDGSLDLPAECGGADLIYIADHQVPLAGGPVHPGRVRAAIAARELAPEAVVAAILEATKNALEQVDNAVIAHLFSVLPKLGLDEATVPIEAIAALARVAAATGAAVEIDERWRCPSARTLVPFLDAKVPILFSTDSHAPETVGRYRYCLEVLDELARGGGS